MPALSLLMLLLSPSSSSLDARNRLVVASSPRDDCPASAEILATGKRWTDQLCDLLAAAEATRSDAVVVLHRGVPVARWASERGADPIHVMSVTKSVVSLAFGRMLLDGVLDSLDTPVHRFYPEWRQGRKRDITIRHLLTHTSGLQDVPNAGIEVEPAPDAVQLALAAELTGDPGTEFRYNNKAANLLSGIVEQATGHRLDEYVAQTVLRDLGIDRFEWITDVAGNPYGMAGLSLTASDLARVGELMRNGGRWGSRAVIDADFAADAVSSRHDLYPRHGYLWWLLDEEGGAAPGGFQSNGWLGQWLVVVPESEIVAVRLIDRSSWTEESDGFPDFVERVRRLEPPVAGPRR